MKRHPALADLSRDHHQTLFVAQQLRRVTDATAAEARAAFLKLWLFGEQRHFEIEEQVLLPAYAAQGDAHHPLVARALCDHVELRRRADAVARERDAATAELAELGTRLAEHVRLEERELFPLIEQTLSDDELSALGTALRRAEETRTHE